MATRRLVTGLLLGTATVLAGAWIPGAGAAESIRIGFHAPLTGFAAGDGKSARLGAELAVEQINAAGGVLGRPLELVTYDDQAKPDQAVPVANKLLGEGIRAAISGSYSGATRAAAAVFQQAKMPYLSAYAIHPDITRTGEYVFRTASMGEVQGRGGAKLIGEILGRKKVVLITLDNDFGQSLARGFKEKAGDFGIEILNEYTYSIKQRQFGAIVASVKRDAPEAIYASGYFFTAGPLVSQLRAGGVRATIVGQEGYDSQNFIDIAKAAAEGVLITTALDRDSDRPEVRTFIEAFEKKAGFPADMVAASTYAAVQVLAQAFERAGGTDGAAVREALAGTRDFPTAIGPITFNALGEIYKPIQVQVVKDGRFRRHAVIDDPVLLAPPAE